MNRAVRCNMKKRANTGRKMRHSEAKTGGNQQSGFKGGGKNNPSSKSHTAWPSDKHKCVLLFHDEKIMPRGTVQAYVKPFGTIAKQRTVALPSNVMSTFEMSTSAEAETAWRELLKNKPSGVVKIIPDLQNMTIRSFSPHWEEEKMKEGLSKAELLSGTLRINPRMFHHSFINDGNNPDVLIDSVVARNRALPGDVVAVKIRSQTEWISDENLQPNELDELLDVTPSSDVKSSRDRRNKIKTGDVVGILEKHHNRLCVGSLVEKRGDKVLFRPVDNCLPRLLIPTSQCPEEFLNKTADFSDKLFLSKLESWDEDSMFPNGNLQTFIGDCGEIEAETTRIVLENNIDDSEFPPSTTEAIPSEWRIPPCEYEERRDLRSECVFTIDPSTARDLDDALHCKKESDNIYEVGVHIADVSYFVKSESELDKIARSRCTSVYLVQKVIPMLPQVLSEVLCSLNPGTDRLTFSVIWKITSEGDIVDEWCGRTVINSCVKLSYDHAQSMIETSNEGLINKNEYPDILGGHPLDKVRKKVLDLHQIAQSLRKRRFDNGALRLNQIKLAYTLDSNTGLPNSCFTYKYKNSNELVEEFMLLANISVAQRLRTALPHHAFLRCHPKPKVDMLNKVALYCEKLGIKLDISSSKSVADSLRDVEAREDAPEHCSLALQLLLIKPQLLAKYFCTGVMEDEDQFRHYALNVPVYTHFTSPIRRYADIIVHRQLSFALGDSRYRSNLSSQDLEKQAHSCNDRKSQAKKAQDSSIQIFFYSLVKTVGAIDDEAVVVNVFDHSFDILPVKYGNEVYRVYLDNLPLVGFKHIKESSTLNLIWPCDGSQRYKLTDSERKLAKDGKLKMPQYTNTTMQAISIFSTVNVVFEASEKCFKVKAYLRRNKQLK